MMDDAYTPAERFANVLREMHQHATDYRPDLRWHITCEPQPDGGAALCAGHTHGERVWGFAIMLPASAAIHDYDPEWCHTIADMVMRRIHVDLVRMN